MEDFQLYLETMLARGKEEGCFPSAAAAVGVKDRVFARAFTGEAPLPGEEPVNIHTRYDMASLSKVLGPTMVALKALENGEIHLTDTVGDFYPLAPEDKKPITIFMLMTHTAGFFPAFRLDKMLDDPAGAADCILNHPLQETPGKRPIYSCMGYILLAKILEKRWGKPLDVLARERVFTPLGMTETGYCPPDDACCAATEVSPDTGKPWIGVVHDESARFLGGVSGNAGVFMSLGDGIRFAGMLSAMGGTFLRRETMEAAIRNYTPGQDAHRGLGFQIAGSPDCFFSADVPDACFGHTGFTGTSLMVDPSSGLWVLLLTNRVYPTRESQGLFAFRRKLHGEVYKKYIACQRL